MQAQSWISHYTENLQPLSILLCLQTFNLRAKGFSITRMCPFLLHDNNCLCAFLPTKQLKPKAAVKIMLTHHCGCYFVPLSFSIMHNVISFWLLPQSVLSSFFLSFLAHPMQPSSSSSSSTLVLCYLEQPLYFHLTTAFFLIKNLT